LLAAGFAGSPSAWADDSASLRSLAKRFDSPANVFTEDENSVRLNHTVEPGRVYVRQIEPPPGLDLQIVAPEVVPIRVAPPQDASTEVAASQVASPRVTAPQVAPIAPPPIGLAMEAPAVVPQRIALPPIEPPPLSLAVTEPPVALPAPIVGSPAAGYARYDEPQPLQIGGLTLTGADQQPPPPAPGAEGSTSGTSSGSIAQVEKLGDAPPSNSLVFLRQSLLLEPGKHQFDWGLTYSVFNDTFALPIVNHSGTVVGVANERQRLRLMTIPFAFRYGLTDGVQVYINAPLGWANSEITTDNGDSINNNFGGMADMSAGFSVQLMKGCGAWVPDLIASLGFIAPTGHATFASSLLASNSFLGQGFWDLTTSFIAVHTLDPVVFYYGGGYVHRFENSIDGFNVNPGEEFDYLFGVGFAMNPWITISGTMIGSTITRYGVNGVTIPGSDQDPIRFRISCTMVKDSRICEPFAEIAMTPDAPSRVGITFTY
jgi:hypothetical protein